MGSDHAVLSRDGAWMSVAGALAAVSTCLGKMKLHVADGEGLGIDAIVPDGSFVYFERLTIQSYIVTPKVTNALGKWDLEAMASPIYDSILYSFAMMIRQFDSMLDGEKEHGTAWRPWQRWH